MFIEDSGGGWLPQHEEGFYVGEMRLLEEEPDPDLLLMIDWKADQYRFDFYEAEIMVGNDIPTSSWIEVAFSSQLGGAFVLWRSGVSVLDAPRSISYGWVESASIESIAQAVETKAATRGPALSGFNFDFESYYENCRNDECRNNPH
jgi:hypothetical protein